MEKSRLFFKRLLALVALVLSAGLIYFVASSNTGSDEDGGKARTEKNDTKSDQPKTQKKVYVIQEGDTLTAIAVETGVPVEKIQSLNPDLDPQVLISGQSIKLR